MSTIDYRNIIAANFMVLERGELFPGQKMHKIYTKKNPGFTGFNFIRKF